MLGLCVRECREFISPMKRHLLAMVWLPVVPWLVGRRSKARQPYHVDLVWLRSRRNTVVVHSRPVLDHPAARLILPREIFVARRWRSHGPRWLLSARVPENGERAEESDRG